MLTNTERIKIHSQKRIAYRRNVIEQYLHQCRKRNSCSPGFVAQSFLELPNKALS